MLVSFTRQESHALLCSTTIHQSVLSLTLSDQVCSDSRDVSNEWDRHLCCLVSDLSVFRF